MSQFKKLVKILQTLTLLFLGIIIIITINFVYNFHKLSFYEFDALLKYKFEINNKRNNILVLGDSSALNGVVPKTIESQTGMQFENLALYANSGLLSYEILLRNYLKKNNSPKLIIFYFSALSPNNWKNISYEKTILILKYGNIKDRLNLILSHPFSLVLITNRAVRATGRYFLIGKNKQVLYFDNINIKLQKNKGFMESKTPNKITKCNEYFYIDTLANLSDDIYNFKKIFPNIKFKVYLAPIMKCAKEKNNFELIYKNIIDNNIMHLDNDYFNDFSHLNIKGAQENSNHLADWILKELNE